MKKKWLSIFLVLAMVLGMMPGMVWADDANVYLDLKMADCSVIGSSDYDDDDVLYCKVADGTSYTRIRFSSDFGTFTGSSSMIAGVQSNYLVAKYNYAPISEAWRTDADILSDEFDLKAPWDSYGFDNCYAYWLTNDDYDTYFVILEIERSANTNESVPTFTVSAGGNDCDVISVEADSYLYEDYMKGETVKVPVHTVSIPAGTEQVDIVLSDPGLLYNYKFSRGTDPATYIAGQYTMDYPSPLETDEACVGHTEFTVDVDANDDGEMDFIQVQSVFDIDNSGELYYAITFEEEIPAEPDGTAFIRIVGADNADYITWEELPIVSGETTLKAFTEAALAQKGATADWADYGFLNSISGCDINGDYWMSMLNDSGDVFNTDNFDTVMVKGGDRLVLYAYGNGDYAWINAKESADVSLMEYSGTEYITGSGTFVLSANSYDTSYNMSTGPVEGAVVTVKYPDGTPVGANDYKVSETSVETDANGAFSIDFYGSCAEAELDDYATSYDLYAEKDGMNTAFCRVTLTKDGLTFSQPEGDAEFPGGEVTDPSAVDIDELLEGISAGYTEKTDPWIVMEMAAYEDYNPSTANKLTDDAVQAFIDSAAEKAGGSSVSDTDLDKLILALQANGYDPQQLYPADSSDPIDLIESLNGVNHSESVWSAPYTLAAYAQGDYGTEEQEAALVQALLASQQADGSWNEYNMAVDSTSNAIAGLSFCLDDAEVKTAVENAVDYLSSVQQADGGFDGGYGANTNTQAMVIIGLCAAGVDPATDSRFVKSEGSALDALLRYALADNSGFGYQDNTKLNASATEQGFRALIAAANVAKGTNPFNVYDFSGNTPLEPAKATGAAQPSTPSDPTGDDIKVKVTVKTLEDSWLSNYSVTVPGDGATAYYALTKAFEANGIEYKVKSGSYIYELTYDGTTLGEYTLGPNSGWLYKVNGKLATVSTGEYEIKNGNTILFYYTEDWTQDPDAASNAGLTEPETPAEDGESSGYFIDVDDSDWYDEYAEKAAELGLFAGYDAGEDEEGNQLYEFRGGDTMTRAMFVTVLRAINTKLNGETASAPDAGFSDVESGAWYEEAVNWAYAAGITAGKGDSFGVDDPVTREQMAVFLYIYAKSAGKVTGEVDLGKLEAFSDADEISDYAKEAIAWLVGEGLMAGRGDGTLAPGAKSTRAEVAAFLVSAYEYLSE